jgi:hypothetical protein
MYLNVENIGQFPLQYFITTTFVKHPSVIYMAQVKLEDVNKKNLNKTTNALMKREKSQIEKSSAK